MKTSNATTRDGVQLLVREAGDGPNVTLVPNGHYLYRDFERLADASKVISYDLRNRGSSQTVTDPEQLSRGVHQDVEDMEDVITTSAGTARIAVIAHSYVAIIAILYAIKHADRLDRMALIGSMQPTPSQSYSTPEDSTLRNAMTGITGLRERRHEFSSQDFCERVWALLRPIYVADPRLASRIEWSCCHLKNEREFMRYWVQHVFPSLQQVDLTSGLLEKVTVPVLLIHGKRDRSAPYQGARDWAARLPDARLVTIENVAHAPWIEAPEYTFAQITEFLGGKWPEAAEIIRPKRTEQPQQRS